MGERLSCSLMMILYITATSEIQDISRPHGKVLICNLFKMNWSTIEANTLLG